MLSTIVFQRNDPVNPTPPSDASHAFDFLHGSWRVRHRRLRTRLERAADWEDFDGTLRCWPLLQGAGNVDDNELQLPAGPYRAATMRIFDADARVWRIWWFDARHSAQIDPPLVGAFEGNVGTFYADDLWKGRPIRVRFLWTVLGADTAQWEQAFSDDAGGTWETNWVMRFERVE